MNIVRAAQRYRVLDLAPWLLLGAAAVAWNRQGGHTTHHKGESARLPAAAAREPGRGRQARDVQRIPPRGWRDIAWRTYREIGKDRLPIVAGGVTFYSLLALFPALGAFVSIYGLFADVAEVERQVASLALILPAGVTEILADQMRRLAETRDSTLSLTFIGSVLFAIWSANAGMNALFDGMNIAFGEAEKRNWFKRRLWTLGSTAGTLVLVTLLSVLLVAVPASLSKYGLAPSEIWWIPLIWLAAFAAVTAGIGALYRFGPSRERAKWSWVWPGAAVAAVGWLVGSILFSIYVGSFANYKDAYGPLGTVIAFMVWIWFSAMVVLLGAEFNAEIEHQTAMDTTTGQPKPIGTRGARMADTIGKPFDSPSFLKSMFRQRGPKKVWGTLRQTGG